MNTGRRDEERAWCRAQREAVGEYLQSEGIEHGGIGESPVCHVAPHFAVWEVESPLRPDWVGWWVIAGNLPTDHISAGDDSRPENARVAVHAIANRWLTLVASWRDGQSTDGIRISGRHTQEELASLLGKRAEFLLQWAEDDSYWQGDQ